MNSNNKSQPEFEYLCTTRKNCPNLKNKMPWKMLKINNTEQIFRGNKKGSFQAMTSAVYFYVQSSGQVFFLIVAKRNETYPCPIF